MPKKNKTLCVDDLRHAEYYGMQPVFDELYHRSLEGENFTDLMDLIPVSYTHLILRKTEQGFSNCSPKRTLLWKRFF